MTDARPILYSFRRCPYAMRARLALHSSGVPIEHREILLRDKPAAFLAASPSATVPALLLPSGKSIDESLDIMLWALGQNDPEHWLDVPQSIYDLIARADGPFKTALDRYKYASRYPEIDATDNRTQGSQFLLELDTMLSTQENLHNDRVTIADMAIAPFVRQFAHVDLDWFLAQPWPNLSRWLANFKDSVRFLTIMEKHPVWVPPLPLDETIPNA
ncbi:MAG: glutathione S-transferase [Marinosulfonomonas sp.]